MRSTHLHFTYLLTYLPDGNELRAAIYDQLYSPSGRQMQRNEYRKINNKFMVAPHACGTSARGNTHLVPGTTRHPPSHDTATSPTEGAAYNDDSTSIRLPFDRAIRRLHYDHSSGGLLHWSAWLRLEDYVTVILMTFDKQSNGRRIEVES